MISTLNLLRLSFAIYRNNTTLFLGYSVWTLLPIAVLFFLQTIIGPDLGIGPLVILQILSVGLAIWTGIVCALLVASIVKRQTIHTEEISQQAMTLMVPVFLVGLIVGIMTIAGLILVILPGLIFIVWYGFAETEVMLGGKHGLDALSASRELTRGKFFPVLWRLIVGNLVLILVYVVMTFGIVGGMEWLTTGQFTLLSTNPSMLVQLFEGIVDAVYLPLFTMFMTLFYLDLKGATVEKTETSQDV